MSDDTMEVLKAEAIEILRHAAMLREAEAAEAGASTQELLPIIRASDFAGKVPPKPGTPDPHGTVRKAFEAGVRFWAQSVARQVSLPQWREIVAAAEREVPQYRNAVRFFENRFSRLRLADGSLVLA